MKQSEKLEIITFIKNMTEEEIHQAIKETARHTFLDQQQKHLILALYHSELRERELLYYTS